MSIYYACMEILLAPKGVEHILILRVPPERRNNSKELLIVTIKVLEHCVLAEVIIICTIYWSLELGCQPLRQSKGGGKPQNKPIKTRIISCTHVVKQGALAKYKQENIIF